MLGGDCRAVVVITCVSRLDPWVRLFRQWGDYVREHVVRQPACAVIVGLPRPHPVTRSAWVASNAACALTRVIPCRKEGASRADRKVRLPLRTGTAVGIQQNRRAKGHTAVSRADVIHVARVAASSVLGINQVNKIIDRSRLTPAFVPPVGTKIGKHAGKVTGSRNTRSGEGCSCIAVTPRATAIGGFEDEVGVVVRETTAAFVHTGDVCRPAARQVARDLHIADERAAIDHCCRAAPRGAAISGKDAHESALADIKVVPGNVQSPKETQSGIVISPARFAISRSLVESAEMRPAIRIRGSGGLVPAKTLTAAGAIQPDRSPSAGRLMVQNNRITKSIVERPLAVRFGETGESGAAISRYRRAGNIDGGKIAAA